MEDKREIVGTAVLSNTTLLPGMLVHFDISDVKSVKAAENAMMKNVDLFIVTLKNQTDDTPEFDDLYKVGVLAKVKQVIKMPNKMTRVLVEVKLRAELLEIILDDPFIRAEVCELADVSNNVDSVVLEAMKRLIKELIADYAKVNEKITQETVKNLVDTNDLSQLLLQTAINLPINYAVKQEFLEAEDISTQYEVINKTLSNEIQVITIKNQFQERVKKQIDDNQREYVLREQMKLIREELGETDVVSDADAFAEEVSKLKASDEVKERINKEINRFRTQSNNPSEASVLRSYIETLLELPWDKMSKDSIDLTNTKKVLDSNHYGLEKVKERIMEYLAVRALQPEGGYSPILCLIGPPGTGKTSIAKSVAEALDKEYVRISLGGVRDEAEIRGHRKTYVGAMPGRIANGLRQAGYKNPLMLLDEIDKLGGDYKGDPSAALLEVLDPEQNSKFRDHYIEIPIDLSAVLFIATANDVRTIPRPLLDRMEIIDVNSYTANEKDHIAKEHLIEKQKKINGIKSEQLFIDDDAIKKIIVHYTRESGVRTLERKIAQICRKAAREIVENHKESVEVTTENLTKYLGNEIYDIDPANLTDEIGIVRGLAWTSVGGETLQIEVNVMPGKGNIMLTGKLGDVMKESATTGLSFIRSISERYDIPEDYFEKHDIHIHIPEGAVPKDGPSAGITMATAMISAITGKLVRANIAMTGEITLRGRVLPIGGLKEKLLAAKVAGITKVLVPYKNKTDVSEISKEITGGLEIVYVHNMDEVLNNALIEE